MTGGINVNIGQGVGIGTGKTGETGTGWKTTVLTNGRRYYTVNDNKEQSRRCDEGGGVSTEKKTLIN